MAGINWTVLTLLVIGLFALSGFFRGWWKEAIVTVFLAFLVFLLLMPGVAQVFINLINGAISLIWQVLPQFILDFLTSLFGGGAAVTTGQASPQIDAGRGQTWLIILLVFIGLAILIGRSGLPAWGRPVNRYRGYLVTWGGSLFGAMLGALNGWLIISLVHAYLTESGLPGHPGSAAGIMAAPTNRVSVQAVNVPTATILDSFLPWLFIGIGLLVIIIAVKSRVNLREEQGFRRIEYRPPPGYRKSRVSTAARR